MCRCRDGYTGSPGACTLLLDPCVAAGTCPEGEWAPRELPGLRAEDRVQSVLRDPARASDFYAFVGSNNGGQVYVYASTNFGETWAQRNTTAAMTGNPWGASIDPNPARDPSTAPTLWSPAGYGAGGAWKSTDGGRTFTYPAGLDAAFEPYNPAGTDLYHTAILPDDPPNHLFVTYHYGFAGYGDGGFGESWDGGATWVVHPPPVGIGTSHYAIPVSGTTWIVIAQDNNGNNGMWRTTSAGRIGGTAAAKYRDGTISTAAWARVGGEDVEHAHGSGHYALLNDGRILVAGFTNGAVSSDGGAHFTRFTRTGYWAPPLQFTSSQMTNIVATDRYAYTTTFLNPSIARAPLDALIGEENWEVDYVATPPAYQGGGTPFGMASTFNASSQRWVIISGTDGPGIWKYIEPGP
jgi:hypothetical protein